jgi:hypothetical protein
MEGSAPSGIPRRVDAATNQWLMFYVTIPRADSTSANVPHPGVTSRSSASSAARAPSAFAADSDWVNLRPCGSRTAAYRTAPA